VAFDRDFGIRCLVAPLVGIGGTLLAGAAWLAVMHPGDTDFFVFYESARAWRAGADLYASTSDYPNLNPPHFVVAFAPFTMLPLVASLVLWQAINAVATVRAAVLIWRELALSRSAVAYGIGVAAAGLTTGLQFGLEAAQPTGLLVLLVTTMWIAARRGNQVVLGVLLGLLLSFKPFFVPLVLIPLRKRQWRTLGWSGAICGAVAATGLAVAGVDAYVRWMETGRQVSWIFHPMNASVMGIVTRMGLAWWTWIMIAVAIVGGCLVSVRRGTSGDAQWLVGGLASILLSPLGWLYYVPVVAGPLIAVAKKQPWMVAAGIGAVWPVPLLIERAATTSTSGLMLLSVPGFSLIALWIVAVYQSLGDSSTRVRRVAAKGRDLTVVTEF
jgi:arabinofuranan 3-O-arabinosyltransferase